MSCTNDNEETYYGCMDTSALNFDYSANIDDGSCLYSLGCTDENACNFNEFAVKDDGSCEYIDNIYYTSNDGSTSVSAIISNKCLSCHNQDNWMISGVLLETYSDVSNMRDLISYAISSKTNNPMPPAGYTQLTECEKLQIDNWINNDFPYEAINR